MKITEAAMTLGMFIIIFGFLDLVWSWGHNESWAFAFAETVIWVGFFVGFAGASLNYIGRELENNERDISK